MFSLCSNMLMKSFISVWISQLPCLMLAPCGFISVQQESTEADSFPKGVAVSSLDLQSWNGD